jgi:hypothetical protein
LESWSQAHQRLRGSDEAIERAGFAYDRRHLCGCLGQHANLILVKHAGLDRLNHQDALQNAAIDERNSEERLIAIFPSLAEVFEARMRFGVFYCNRTHVFGDEAHQALLKRETKSTDTFGAKPHGRSQHETGPIGPEQINGANFRFKPAGNQRHYVHQRLGRLAAPFGEIADFIERQDVTGVALLCSLAQVADPLVVSLSIVKLNGEICAAFLAGHRPRCANQQRVSGLCRAP